MNYPSGEQIELGDTVRFDIGPDRIVNALVVMLGSDGSHLDIRPEYLEGIKEINLVEKDMIVTEYLDSGGKATGNYLPTTVLSVDLIKRKNDENS